MHSIVLITSPTDRAEVIAKHILEKRLAACVNMIHEVRSMYWWKGELISDKEVLMMIKTRTELVGGLILEVKKIHPYETPEVVSFPITQGFQKYLDWISAETRVEND